MGLLVMAVLFGPGDVQEQTSFGLTQVITILSTNRARLGFGHFPTRGGSFQSRGGEPNTIQYAIA
jgi:hypothetical protein